MFRIIRTSTLRQLRATAAAAEHDTEVANAAAEAAITNYDRSRAEVQRIIDDRSIDLKRLLDIARDPEQGEAAKGALALHFVRTVFEEHRKAGHKIEGPIRIWLEVFDAQVDTGAYHTEQETHHG